MMTPEEMIKSGLLERYVEGELNEEDRRAVEQAAANDQRIAAALDILNRQKVERVLSRIQAANPQSFIESGLLEAYANGELCEDDQANDRLEVELMAYFHPAVKEALVEIETVTELLARGSGTPPRGGLKDDVFAAIEAAENEGHRDQDQPPVLNRLSTADDYLEYVRNGNGLVPPHFDNLFVVPMHFSAVALTMFVCVKRFIEEEVHLDSIEKFLVLEGECRIEMDHESVDLKAGDYLSIPKFTRHTVFVTSLIPCKLIVQQVAA